MLADFLHGVPKAMILKKRKNEKNPKLKSNLLLCFWNAQEMKRYVMTQMFMCTLVNKMRNILDFALHQEYK